MASKRSCFTTVLAWLLLLGIIGVTAIALLTSRYGWKIYLEVFSHFQFQYFVLSTVSLIVLALTRCSRLFLLGLFCVTLLATQIVTWYFPPKFITSQAEGNFRILVANINTQNKQYEDVLALTREEDPDLALFMEVDDGWIDQLNTLSPNLPYSSGQANPYNLGIVLYSRYTLEDPQLTFFGDQSTPSVTGRIRVADRTFSLVGTHPLPPAKPSFFHARNHQLDQLGQYLQTIDQPQLVIGDLNITMWSPYYKRFIRNTGLKNARKGFGLLPSWPTPGTYRSIPGWATRLFAIPIDHCLLSPEIQVVNVRTGPNLGSDHRPLIVDLSA